MSDEFTCPKCDGKMEQGWILDEGYSSRFQTAWVEGEPQSSIFGFLTGGKTPRGKTVRSIESYRCTQCGYVELYAVKETDQRPLT
jgi:predicted nucleic-acid-binding Zn-ribbon protein